jgi:hypothetical protein
MTSKRRDGNESPFSQWIRAHPGLDSITERLSVTDCDFWIHQYRAHHDKCGARAVDSIMLVELKTFCADVSYAQRDTFDLVHQLLRKSCVAKDGKRRFVRLRSQRVGERRVVRCFGVHTLILESDRPDRSSIMYWDGRLINEDVLVELLVFARDPDYPMRFLSTDRRHHTLHPVFARQLRLV